MSSSRIDRITGTFAFVVGVVAVVAPRRALRLLGVSDVSGAGVLGWRLFGIRNIGLAILIHVGRPGMRRFALVTQLPDSLSFVAAGRTGRLNVPATVFCLTGSGFVTTMCLAADAAERREA